MHALNFRLESLSVILILLLCSPLIVSSQALIEPHYILLGRDSMPANGEQVSDTLIFFDREKGALRGGILSNSPNWSSDSLGAGSIGFGYNAKASGLVGAIALGSGTNALGDYGATALGYSTSASGSYGATALGNSTKAIGSDGATALGYVTVASGSFGATALGSGTSASGFFGATAMGYISMASGDYGATALGYSTSASGFQGATALGRNTTASGAEGATALGYFTTASGSDGATALGYLTTTSGDYGATALGNNTIASGTDGATALGSYTIARGSDGATAMGRRTTANGDVGLVIGQYNDTIVAVGQNVIASSPLFIIGNGDSDSMANAMVVRKDGNIGIGTNHPEAKVHIGGIGNDSQLLLENGGDILWKKNDSTIQSVLSLHTNNDIFFDSPEDFILRSNAQQVVQIESGGNVGIGTITPGEKLDVEGNARFRSIGTTISGNMALHVTSDGTLSTNASDIRLKENIHDTKDILAKALQLKTYSYNYKSDPKKRREYGMIAQELEKLFPELVFTNPTSGYKGIHYDKLSVILLESVKQQNQRVEILEKQVRFLLAQYSKKTNDRTSQH